MDMDEEKAEPQPDQLRLEMLRRLVQSGEYEVPADKIADRLIDLSTTLKQD
jgi:anti-sigma28 factor (negative regulator of flagellin synthesis)